MTSSKIPAPPSVADALAGIRGDGPVPQTASESQPLVVETVIEAPATETVVIPAQDILAAIESSDEHPPEVSSEDRLNQALAALHASSEAAQSKLVDTTGDDAKLSQLGPYMKRIIVEAHETAEQIKFDATEQAAVIFSEAVTHSQVLLANVEQQARLALADKIQEIAEDTDEITQISDAIIANADNPEVVRDQLAKLVKTMHYSAAQAAEAATKPIAKTVTKKRVARPRTTRR